MRYLLSKPQSIQELGQRANQEDTIFPEPDKSTATDRLFIVCDGMGGHYCGEVASETVCNAITEYWEKYAAIVSSKTVVVCAGERISLSISAINCMPISVPCFTWLPG